MADFLLVHGAWHASWCWEKIVPLLEKRGHSVRTLDLPSFGDDPTPKSAVTLATCAQKIVDALARPPGKTILVGHSMGGIMISEAGELAPDRIARLVYVCAFLPKNGESLATYASQDAASLIPASIEPKADGTGIIKPDKARAVFYGECSDADAATATARLEATPNSLPVAPVSLTNEAFGRIEKHFIRCNKDRATSPVIQDKMCANWPLASVSALDTDHSPFLSAPEALADILLRLA